MIDTSLTLLPFLIADIVNPVLFAFMVFAAGTNRPILNSCTVLLGHTLAYFIVGIAVSSGLEKITDYLNNPHAIDYALGFLVGLLLLWAAYLTSKKKEENKAVGGESLTLIKAFGLGALINFIGAPFALPYFAAIDQILKADLPIQTSLSLLIAYNLLYALPFLIIPALIIIYKERSTALLQRINSLLDRASRVLMPLILIAVGIALIVDAILFYSSGKGLF